METKRYGLRKRWMRILGQLRAYVGKSYSIPWDPAGWVIEREGRKEESVRVSAGRLRVLNLVGRIKGPGELFLSHSI